MTAALPSPDERLALAELALSALGTNAETPPEIGVHPRRSGSTGHVLPAFLRGEPADGSADLVGVEWVVGSPDGSPSGPATYGAQMILNDARNGLALAIIDAGAISAHAGAGVSGAAIRLFAPRYEGRVAAVAILGAGVPAAAGLPLIGHLLAGCSVRLTDPDAERALALAVRGAGIEGVGSIEVVAGVKEAVSGADVVLSTVHAGAPSSGPGARQALDPGWLGREALFVATDADSQAPASLACEALFVVDDRDRFLAARGGGEFAGYPDPAATLGEMLRDGPPRPVGRVLVTQVGLRLADFVLAAAILRRAEQIGLGVALPR